MEIQEIKTERMSYRVQIIIEGETIADTTSAVLVREIGFEPVIYIPKNDIKEIDLIKCGDNESAMLAYYAFMLGVTNVPVTPPAWEINEDGLELFDDKD